jgi:GNAT superfamily N-acetyltransferase
MILKELHTKDDMMAQLHVLQELYPTLTHEDYSKELDAMLPNNRYFQVAVFEEDTCVGLTGVWIGTKLWSGKYAEIDNLVVCSAHRSKGAGKLLIDYVKAIAQKEGCSMVALDSYTTNFNAHKLFYNEGFGPKGFHFIHVMNNELLR